MDDVFQSPDNIGADPETGDSFSPATNSLEYPEAAQDTEEAAELFSSGSSESFQGTEGEAYVLTVSDYGSLMVSSIPVGALLGAIFMIVGLTVLGIVKIFKKA